METTVNHDRMQSIWYDSLEESAADQQDNCCAEIKIRNER